jgi:hypothetical protein
MTVYELMDALCPSENQLDVKIEAGEIASTEGDSSAHTSPVS